MNLTAAELHSSVYDDEGQEEQIDKPSQKRAANRYMKKNRIMTMMTIQFVDSFKSLIHSSMLFWD